MVRYNVGVIDENLKSQLHSDSGVVFFADELILGYLYCRIGLTECDMRRMKNTLIDADPRMFCVIEVGKNYREKIWPSKSGARFDQALDLLG